MACERGKDYEKESNWYSRNSEDTYVVGDFDVSHDHVFKLEVRFESETHNSDGYSKFAYCYSQIIE